jgi:cation diffusion facilitator family transporter
MFNQKRYDQARRVTLIGAIANFILAVLKVAFGIIGHSQALLADGIHSFSDLVTDFMVLFASKTASQGPDQDHPYGHGRIETMFTVGLSIFLALVGAGIIFEAIERIIHPQLLEHPTFIVLIVAVVSIVVNEWLFRYTQIVGKRIKSKLVIANAWHHRSDAFSSIVVLVGVIGTMLGIHFFDAAAAIVVALMIINMGIKMAWQAIKELVDTGVDADQEKAIVGSIKDIPGVRAVHQFRSRSLAGEIFVDAHIQVAPRLSVSEGHFIADHVQRRLRHSFPELLDITIHIDPEDDEDPNVCVILPARHQVEQALNQYCESLPGFDKKHMIYLDYLNGKIYITLVLSLSVLHDGLNKEQLKQQYQNALKSLDYLGGFELLFY